MKILITGGAGFVGSHAAEYYALKDEEVIVLDSLSSAYSARQFGSDDQGWVAHFTISTLTNRAITIYGDGKQVRDVLFVSDSIKAFDAFIKKKDKYSGEVYNIGWGSKFTLSLLELLEKETGKRSMTSFEDWRPSDQKVYISAKRELGWDPGVNVRDGVKTDWSRRTRECCREALACSPNFNVVS